MFRTYKRKLILTKAQRARIDSWMGVSRLVYNMGLEIRIAAWKNRQQSVHKYELMKQVTSIRDIEWVKDVAAEVLQESIERLDRAYNSFYRTFRSGGGFPKYASKKRHNSISFKTVKISNTHILAPKLGMLRMVKDAKIIGDARTLKIKKEPTGYFACIQCVNVPKKFTSENQAVGIDMGITHFCIDSNGKFIVNPRHFKKYERRLKIENRTLARKKKGSNGWKKQCKRISVLHHKIANVRADFLHKESTRISKENSLVYLEDLKISSMVLNRPLSKHILDAGWGMFRKMLEYKTSVIVVNPKYTSQTCVECGNIDSKSRISQSEFCCTACGHISNADYNAAKNILSKGIALSRQRESKDCALTLKHHLNN